MPMLISKWRVAFKQNWKPKGCLFFNINSQNFAEISQSSVEKKSRIYLPCFSNLQSAPIIFTKLMKIQIALMRRFIARLIIYLVGILVVGSSLEEIVMSRGHIDFHITEPGVCYKLSKIRFEFFSSNSIPGERNRLAHCESILVFTKEGIAHFAIPGSVEPIRFHMKASDTTDRSSLFNSNGCSLSTLKAPIFTASANSKVSRETKFQ